MLGQFISYFGAKSKIGAMYPAPKHKTLVEPFAGGAGYSLRYHLHDVVLIEKQLFVYEVWKWLIEKATPKEILGLPILGPEDDLRKMDLEEIHKKFLGFQISPNIDRPVNIPRKGLASHWTTTSRSRIARSLEHIRHWRIFHGNYSVASDVVKGPATWFIDPPYQLDRHANAYRPHTSKRIDFYALGDWCRSLDGQVIVCEQKGADWLPFHALAKYNKGGGGLDRPKTASEVVWLSEGNYRTITKGFFKEEEL